MARDLLEVRGELAALFWPDRSEEVARGSLRELPWRLAREPLPVGLERERTRVRRPVRADHAAFVDACRSERWTDAWDLGGELLAGAEAVRTALTRARHLELLAPGLGALVPMARILGRRGARARARRLAGFLCGHPRASHETRREAARLPGAEHAGESGGRDEGPEGVLSAFDQAIADL